MAHGGFGAVVLGRNHLELWRERVVYRQRAKAVGLIGTHPRWPQVLVALDLGPVSRLVLRHLERTLLSRPEVRPVFLHVLQNEGEKSWALKR